MWIHRWFINILIGHCHWPWAHGALICSSFILPQWSSHLWSLFGSKWFCSLPSMDVSVYKPPVYSCASHNLQCQVVLCIFFLLPSYLTPSQIDNSETPLLQDLQIPLWMKVYSVDHCKHILRPVMVLLPGRKEAGLWRKKKNLWWQNWSGYASFKKNVSPNASRKVSKNS